MSVTDQKKVLFFLISTSIDEGGLFTSSSSAGILKKMSPKATFVKPRTDNVASFLNKIISPVL